jgi:C-terminal peptidase prc
VGFVSAVTMFFTAFFAGLFLVSDPMLHQMVAFNLTVQSIARAYPVPFSTGEALNNAERSMINLLDPFSFRMTHREYQNMVEESTGKYSGIGITVVARDTALMIITVREGGPAAKAGIASGDYIISVNESKVQPDDPLKAVEKIRGSSGTTVDLTLYRSLTGDTLSVTVTRQDIKLEHLPYYGMIDSLIAYIRVADFESGSSNDFKKAIKDLEQNKPVGYIIDLKSNPGGYLDEAIKAAELFMDPDELIVGVDARSRWDNREFYSRSDPITTASIAILIDQGSASAAEIFTGALGGAERAVIIGDTTFGKGLVQTLFGLANGEAIRLTTSRYYFADGHYLNPPDSQLEFVGLAPDIVYRDHGEAAFRQQFLTGFLVYEFVEQYWLLLTSYPSEFAYPDTVVQLFADYTVARGFNYQSILTETVELAQLGAKLDPVSDELIRHLETMIDDSRKLDEAAFARHADLIKLRVKQVVLERQGKTDEIYLRTVVQNRPEVRLATEILKDSSRYKAILDKSGKISAVDIDNN